MTHEKILFLYISAVESGDLDTLRDIWALVEDDPRLSAKLIELNAEIGETPMAIYNGKVQAAGSRQRKSYSIPFTRTAILLFLLAGIISIALSLSQAGEEPTTSVPLYGTTPTPIPLDTLTVISKDNVSEMVEIDRFGSGIIQGAVWSHDNSQIVAYGESVWVFDAAFTNEVDVTQEMLESAKLTDLPFITDMAVLAGDGTQLAVASSEGKIALIDLSTGLIQELADVDGEITDFAAHKNLIAWTDGDNNLAYVWDSDIERERLVVRTLDDNVNALAFSEDGSMLAVTGSVSRDVEPGMVVEDNNIMPRLSVNVVQVWDMDSGEMINVLVKPAEHYPFAFDFPYTAVTFADNRLYANAGSTFHWWELDNLEYSAPEGTEVVNIPNIAASIRMPDSDGIAGISNPIPQATINKFLDRKTLDWLEWYDGYFEGFPRSIDVNNERILLTAEYAISVYEIPSDAPIQQLNFFNNALSEAQVSYPYVAYRDSRTVSVWNLETGTQVASWQGGARDMDFTPDGTHLAIANGYSQVQGPDNLVVWNFVEDEETWLGGPSAIAVAVNGDSMAYITISGVLIIMDIEIQVTTGTIVLDYGEIQSAPVLDFHPTSPLVAVTHWSREIEVYEIDSESLALTLTGHSDVVANLSFSHDGSMMASVDLSGNVIIWDTATWEEIAYRSLSTPGGNLAFSPDDNLLAVSSERDIVVLDVETLEPLHQFQGNADFITGLDFDDSGKMLVSAGHDGVLRTWGIPE
ncbi:MAG: WD40 repeat domain-containing protein [Chloroflexi bacterium]|nr:WD40 repeat domain-containing protein [Chloroflexota bacterium]